MCKMLNTLDLCWPRVKCLKMYTSSFCLNKSMITVFIVTKPQVQHLVVISQYLKKNSIKKYNLNLQLNCFCVQASTVHSLSINIKDVLASRAVCMLV
jgi:hypothetical protein